MSSHVVILGCGRSGTSIFGELFEHIPGYSYYSEPSFDTIASLCFATPTAIKVPKESGTYPPPPGLSFPLNAMLGVLPEPRRFYWQVRDPLDAIASLRVGIANNWGHHPRPPDWQAWLNRPLIERCAHHWAYLNTAGYSHVREIARVCRFETMLADPAEFALQICVDIGVDSASCAAELSAWARRVQDTNNEHFIEAKTSREYSRPDHERRVGRWRENLSRVEVRQILPIVRNAAEAFGYALPRL